MMNLLLLSLQHDHFQSGYCGGTPEETPVLHCPNTEATLYFVIWPVGECADMTAFHGRDMLSQIPGGRIGSALPNALANIDSSKFNR